VTGGVSSPKASLAAVAGPAAVAGMVVVAMPGAAVLAIAAVVDATVKTAASPSASPMAAGVAVRVVEPGSYFAPPPPTPPSSGAWRSAPPLTVIVRVFVMLGIYFVSVKYMFVKCKAFVWLCETFENLKVQVKRVFL
jgi:hypothetical protein